jgi:hypothetical protein
MSIPLLTALLGVAAATATVVFAYRLVPPLRETKGARLPIRSGISSEGEAEIIEAIQRVELERREEIDALRQIMLEQRLELSKLRRTAREQRERQMRDDRRTHELEIRERRAGHQARHLSRQPVAALALKAPENP